MKRVILSCLCIAVFAALMVVGCEFKNAPVTPTYAGFPSAVGKIFINKCATAGCHNAASYTNAGNLLLDSWEHLFQGSANGAVVVPYSVKFSSLLFFINTNPANGSIASPTMPVNGTPLSADEYATVANWIQSGAPDADGNIAFASNPDTRQKIYITMQGCDLLAVVDAQSKLIMRYIPIGAQLGTINSPHCVRVSPDGAYAYVAFYSSPYIQKIDTKTDTVVASLNLGANTDSWSLLHVSPDGNNLLVTNYIANGSVKKVSNDMVTNTSYGGGFTNPHGIANNPTFDTFFVTSQYGNVIYKFSQFKLSRVTLDGKAPAFTGSVYQDPHEIMMTPNYSKYFVTCQYSNEVRVMDALTDTLIKTIAVGTYPQEIAVSLSKHCMFITCKEDVSSYTGFLGSVYAIDYNTYATTRIDGKFYRPHGITVDDKNGVLYIVSSNANGIASHHATACGGDGWYNVYDLNTLTPINNTRYETTNMPYSADTRFK